MTQSDYVSLTAAAIALLAALYARWTAGEAKRANDISLHVHKVEIYEEVVAFSDCFRGLFTVPSEERLETFHNKAVRRAEIYLSQQVHYELTKIYEHCHKSELWLDIVNSKGGSSTLPNEYEVRAEYKAVLNQLYPVIKSIKNEARIY